ncbi:MAG: NAD-dependent epimerase/dehydratase family protein [bacterium]
MSNISQDSQSKKLKVAIAGASGFVGRALIEKLRGEYDLIALSRGSTRTEDGIEWRQCDLFNLKQAEQGLAGADMAIYLVHSMLPSAKLTQGSFADLDLLIADNFARAAKKAKVQKIIYLGGIIPQEELSPHLASRLEVEAALESHGVPCVALRAGLIIGKNGSSFDIMRKLVDRLPMMVCPGWTRTRSQPVSLKDVVETITRLLQRPEIRSGQYDLGSRDVMTYIDMMREVARQLGKKRLFLPIFLFSPNLSRLWVTLVTGAPRELIGPLVQSLRHEMVARDLSLMENLGIEPQGFKTCLAEALEPSNEPSRVTSNISTPPRAVTKTPSKPIVNLVCSVQRLPLIVGRTAAWVTKEYANWLIQFFRPLIFVRQDADGSLAFILRPIFARFDVPLLELTYGKDRSSEHRQMFYISGGLLLSSKFHPRGRFEFREVLNGKFVLVAIFDFVPALPWWIYKNTQAILHLFVMAMFRRHLKSLYLMGTPD